MDFKAYLEKLRALPDKQKTIILWTIVIILGVVLVYFWINLTVKRLDEIGRSVKIPDIQIPQTQFPSAQTADQTTSWKTYTNSDYGFSFNYPSSSTISNFSEDYSISFGPPAPGLIAYFRILNDSEQTEGFMAINVYQDENCVAGATFEKSINQINFAEYDSGTGGVAGFQKNYKILKNNNCFDIQLNAQPSACINSGCDNRLWSEKTERNILNELDKYVQTFKFTK